MADTLSIALNNHSLFLDAAGNLALTSNLDACLQDCETAMLAQRSEMIYAMDEGVPYRQTSWDQYRPAQFEAAARTSLLAVNGVVRIRSFTFSFSGNTLSYSATIETEWGIGGISSE